MLSSSSLCSETENLMYLLEKLRGSCLCFCRTLGAFDGFCRVLRKSYFIFIFNLSILTEKTSYFVILQQIVGQNAEENQKMYGRHFDSTDELVSRISRASIDSLKANYRVIYKPQCNLCLV